MNNKNICIIGAMDSEIQKLKSLIENIEEIKQGELTFYKGKIFDRNVVLVKSGVGKVCGAVCTQILADKFNPAFIINTGIAGGLSIDLNIGDIIIAEKLVQHDFDATAIGYAKGYICNNTNSKEPTYFYTDKNLVKNLEIAITNDLQNIIYHKGVVASGDVFIGTKEKKKELNNMFNAIAAEMEGAAIAHACTLNQIPFIIIRVISDLADEHTAKEHVFKEQEAADKAASAIEAFLKIQSI